MKKTALEIDYDKEEASDIGDLIDLFSSQGKNLLKNANFEYSRNKILKRIIPKSNERAKQRNPIIYFNQT
jgi:hypothetical protein